MNFFDDISKKKRDFPKFGSVAKEINNYSLNFYQILSIILFIIFIILGLFFGNLFSTCEASSYFYSSSCRITQFNFSLMIFIWFFGSILSLFIFAIGHIISILSQINKKLSKFKS